MLERGTLASGGGGIKGRRGHRTTAFSRVWAHSAGRVGTLLVAILYLLCFAGPLVYRASPTKTDPRSANEQISTKHPLGTDELGRDELARALHGGRVTLSVGLVSMLLALFVGVVIGGTAAFMGGVVETLLMRLVDLFLAVPPLFLILVFLTVLGNGTGVVIAVVGLSFWASVARAVYADVLQLRGTEFVEAALALGVGRLRIFVRHILPQIVPNALVLGTLVVAWSILTSAALSYLGMGIQPPTASWGNMLQKAQSYIWINPVLVVVPGLAISLTVLGFNLLGNALRDVLDPKRHA